MEDKLARAYAWMFWGADLLPVQPKSKYIVGGFGPNKTRIRTEADAFRWYEERHCNMALVLDHGFVAADFDDEPAYLGWAAEHGADVLTYTERTARGAHLIWRGQGLPAGCAPGIEFKNAGALLIAPSIHPSGQEYLIVRDVAPSPLSFDQARALFPFLSRPIAKGCTADLQPAFQGTGKVAVIKSKVPIMAELDAAGVKAWHRGGSAVIGCCPFHKDRHPSLWVKPDVGVWGCNVPSCRAHGVHDVIDVRALRRGLTVQEAIRELWEEVR